MERRAGSGRRSDERWQSILAGASRAFRRLGYAQTTLEDVAGEVGINRATLYYYVGTKEELLIALLRRPMLQMTAEMRAIADLDLAPSERLRRILLQYVTDMAETPELTIFVAQSLHQVMSGREAADIEANADEYGRAVTTVIEEGVAAGEFRGDVEPRLAMLAIIGMFNWIHRWYRPDGELTLAQIGDTFCDLALASLAVVNSNVDDRDRRA